MLASPHDDHCNKPRESHNTQTICLWHTILLPGHSQGCIAQPGRKSTPVEIESKGLRP